MLAYKDFRKTPSSGYAPSESYAAGWREMCSPVVGKPDGKLLKTNALFGAMVYGDLQKDV